MERQAVKKLKANFRHKGKIIVNAGTSSSCSKFNCLKNYLYAYF